MNKTLSILLVGAVVTLLQTSCDNSVDYESELAHQNNIVYARWTWPDQRPTLTTTDRAGDVVTTLGVRTTNLLHYYCEVARPRNNSWQRLDHTKCPSTPAEWSDTLQLGGSDAIKFKEGAYNFISFNSNGKKSRFKVDYSHFLASNMNYFDNLTLMLNTYTNATRGTEGAFQKYFDVMDLPENHTASFLAPFTNTIWYSLVYDKQIKQGNDNQIDFTDYRQVTQDLILTFTIDETDDYKMYIDTIRGSITGALNTINITKGTMPTNQGLHQQLFTIGTTDSYKKSEDIKATVTMPIFGLLHNTETPAEDETTTNNVNLNLYIDLLYKDDANVEHNEMLTVSYPLDSLLRLNPSVVYVNEGTVRQKYKTCNVNIREKLLIGPGYVNYGNRRYDWQPTIGSAASAPSRLSSPLTTGEI